MGSGVVVALPLTVVVSWVRIGMDSILSAILAGNIRPGVRIPAVIIAGEVAVFP
jgi:hypothetical protein